jgi:hypothetical protein
VFSEGDTIEPLRRRFYLLRGFCIAFHYMFRSSKGRDGELTYENSLLSLPIPAHAIEAIKT